MRKVLMLIGSVRPRAAWFFLSLSTLAQSAQCVEHKQLGAKANESQHNPQG
jgi:hypothetical protein